jgi:tetratricopeptide (TPR) repeat protein
MSDSISHSDIRRGSSLSWLFAVLVAVIAAAVYLLPAGGVLGYDFAFDDIHLIATNDSLRDGVSPWSGFTADYYTTGARSATGEVRALGYYRPLSVLSTWIDHALWGLNPRGYHITNLLLHVITSLLVFALARRLVPHVPAAFTAALLFAVHPAHPESVAFISGRVDVLAAAFGIGSLLAFSRRWRATPVPVALFACAFLSKEMAITIPVLAFLLARTLGTERVRSWAGSLRAAAPLIAAAVVLFAIRFMVLRSAVSAAGVEADAGSVFARMGTVLASYLGLLVWPPLRFNVEPPVVAASGIALIGMWLVVVLAAAIAVALSRSSGWKPVAVGTGWVLISLLPVSQLLPVETFLSERYLYIPSVGACLALAALLWRLPRPFAIVATAALTLAYGANTLARLPAWESNLTFWQAKAELNPTSAEAHSALGLEHDRVGHPREAAAAYQEALRLDPGHLEALNNYALFLMNQGLLEEAIGPAAETVRLSPKYPEGLNTLATVFFNLGRFGDAVGQYRRAVRARPTYRQAWINLGNTYLTASVPDSALGAYRRAVELGRDPDLEVQVARCYAMTGRPEAGMQYLHEVGTVTPNSAESFVIQGNLDFMAGNRQAGIASVLRATQVDANAVDAWIELGQMMDMTGNTTKAIEAFERALTIDPNLSVARNNLGVVEENRGNLAGALRHYRQAHAIAPDDPVVMRNLGGVLVEQGEHAEALALLQRAIPLSRRDALAYFYRGRAHQGLQNLSPALADYRTAASINPTFADAHYRLGELLILRGDAAEGRAALAKFLEWSAADDPRRAEVEALLTEEAP